MKNRAVIEDHYFIKYVCADSIILNVHEDTLCALLRQPTPRLQNYSSHRMITYQETELVILCCVYMDRAATMTRLLRSKTLLLLIYDICFSLPDKLRK